MNIYKMGLRYRAVLRTRMDRQLETIGTLGMRMVVMRKSSAILLRFGFRLLCVLFSRNFHNLDLGGFYCGVRLSSFLLRSGRQLYGLDLS